MIYFLIALCLTPVLWFVGKGGFLINGVDTNFPLDPIVWISRRFFVWNDTINGGSDFSSSTAGIFFHSIQTIPYLLGLNLQVVQIISLVFWFSLIIFSAFIFIKNKTKSKLAQVIFVLFYSFNTYMFNSWENVKVANLSLVAAIPLTFWIFDKLISGSFDVRKSLIYIAGIGLVVGGAGINPAYLICWLVALLIYSFSSIIGSINKKSLLSIARSDIAILSVVTCVNLFWILPTANYIIKDVAGSESLSSIGFTNWIDSLSENTSLINVIRLQGAWDWYAVDDATGLPLYIPYANNYFNNLPFIVFSYLIPIIAFGSFVFSKKKDKSLYICGAIFAILAVFLGAGTHPPTGVLFKWMISHVPFFGLFRSPWYIFTPILTFAYALLIALLFSNLKIKKTFLVFGFLVLAVGNFFYNYPLVTGKVFRPTRYDSFFVAFPDYVFDTKNYLFQNPELKIIGYPDEDIEQFQWGYRGVEPVLNLFARNQVFFRPINDPDSSIANLVNQFYKSVKRGEMQIAKQILVRMNTTTLFEKTEQPTLAPKLPDNFSDRKKTFGAWNFFDMDASPNFVSIYNNYVQVDSSNPITASALLTDSLVVNNHDSVVQDISEINDKSSNIAIAENLQVKEYEEHKRDKQLLTSFENSINVARFNLDISKSGQYQPLLENYKLDAFNLNINNLNVIVDGRTTTWQGRLEDDYISFNKVFLEQGQHTISIPIQDVNLLSKVDDSQHSVANFDFNCYYAGVIDNSSQEIKEVVIRQFNDQTAVKTQVKTAAVRSKSYFFYEPVVTPSELTIAYPDNEVDVQLKRLFCNDLLFIHESQKQASLAEVSIEQSNPTLIKGQVNNADQSHTLVFDQNYSSNWRIQIYDGDNNLVDAKIKHFTGDYYKNAWFIQDPPESYWFEITYEPQRLFNIGMLVSLTSILGFGGAFVWVNKKAKTKH